LTHSEGGVGVFDFGSNCFGGGGSGDTVNDKTSPSLADPRGGDWVFVECIFEDGEVGFVACSQVLGCDCEDEVVGGSDVCQDKGWVGDVRVAGDGLVDDLEGTVGGFLSVVWCSRQVKDNQSVCRWVRLRENGLLSALLLALHLCELLWLFLLRYLCVGRVRGRPGFGSGGRRSVGLGGCCHGPGGWGSDCGGWAG